MAVHNVGQYLGVVVIEFRDWNLVQCDVGSIRQPRCRSTMSQHVPMSLRARTAADIIIVYSMASLWCERFSSFSSCTDSFVECILGEGSVALARTQCVLRVCLVSLTPTLTL